MAASEKNSYQVVGTSPNKMDGLALACGTAEFVEDQPFEKLLHLKFLWSPHAHARITSMDTSLAEIMPGVHGVYSYKNTPRVMRTTAGQGAPEPSPYDFTMFDSKVRYVGDRVAAVVAETPELAKKALAKIEVEYEVLPAVLSAREAMADGAPVIHDEEDCSIPIPVPFDPKHNLASHVDADIGDVEKGFSEADVVLEGEFANHYGQHTPMEPHVAIAYLDPNDRIVIRSSTQVPFHVRRLIAQALELPVKKIRVIKPRIGGGFGTKQEVLIEDVVALAAMRTRRPVLLRYTRAEEFISSRTRHPMHIKLKAGVKKNGALTAIDMQVLSNTGAYGSHALTVVCNSGSKTLPLYRCPNIRFNADVVYTNLPVAGAYRGYGATQATLAMETLWDELAEKLGMDPILFRQINHIQEGESSPVFAALGEGTEGVPQTVDSCGLDECVRRGAEAIGWYEKRGKIKSGSRRRGLGMVCLMQGSSVPEIDMGAASLKMNEDGSFNLLLGATDIGTGSDTILSQIAAEVLGITTEQILVYSSDTDMTPFDVGAYASSTTYLTGMAVKKTAGKVAAQIRKVAAEALELDQPDSLVLADGQVSAPDGRSITLADIAMRSLYTHNQFQIAATESHFTHKSPPPFSAHFAEVEVDTKTGKVRIINYVAAVECGFAINPELARGQINGAVLNGLSYALTEEYHFSEKGRMLNPSFRDYKIFSSTDLPKLETIIVTRPEPTGPYGAKSVSEIGINGPCPVIANAIYDAVGIRLRETPFTPEKVLKALRSKS